MSPRDLITKIDHDGETYVVVYSPQRVCEAVVILARWALDPELNLNTRAVAEAVRGMKRPVEMAGR